MTNVTTKGKINDLFYIVSNNNYNTYNPERVELSSNTVM